MHVFFPRAGIVKQEGGKEHMHAHAEWTVLATVALALSGPPADAQDSGRLTGGFAGRAEHMRPESRQGIT